MKYHTQLSLDEIKAELKRHIQARQYKMDDFWPACGQKPKDLMSKSRETELKDVRQVGMTWALLSGHSLPTAGRIFNRNHSTAIHSIRRVLTAMENPKQYPEIIAIVAKIQDMTYEYPASVRDTQAASALNLELYVAKYHRTKFVVH